jgi:hypothetical protein
VTGTSDRRGFEVIEVRIVESSPKHILLQRFGPTVDDSIDLGEVTRALCTRHLSHLILSLPTANLLRVVVARRAAQRRLSECSSLEGEICKVLDAVRSRAPTPHHLVQQLASTLALLCEHTVSEAAADALHTALTVASRGIVAVDDHEVSNSFGSISQIVCAIARLPVNVPSVAGLQGRGAALLVHCSFECRCECLFYG